MLSLLFADCLHVECVRMPRNEADICVRASPGIILYLYNAADICRTTHGSDHCGSALKRAERGVYGARGTLCTITFFIYIICPDPRA